MLHKDYDRSVRNLPTSIRQKALWAQVLLGTRGRTPSVKGTSGLEVHWRRTPVQGNHFYMWWIPKSESGLSHEIPSNTIANVGNGHHDQSILIHSIRHHDQTSYPINLGYLDDYQEIHVADLDPRFEEQRWVSEQVEYALLQQSGHRRPIALTTVKGLPGSGKTISLLYLVRDVLRQAGEGKILYITYTPRLKRAAEEFLMAQDESFAERVQLRTLSEVQRDFTGIRTPTEPFQALDDFCKFLDLQNTSTLGSWRRYPHALYTEIRANLLGRNFPDGYRLLGEKVGEQSTRLLPLDARGYAKMRKIELDSAEIAYTVSLRAAASRFFQEQKAAQKSLEVLISGKMPPWLPELSGVIVDEVQDLTVLQIAFLGEMVRTAIDVQSRRAAKLGQVQQGQSTAFGSDTPFVFTIAGDESQIVQPTGFDWGITKEMLGLQLETEPEEFEFQHQRRSPQVLASLIEASWRFYGHLPKSHRPSARHDAFIDESVADEYLYEDSGRVLLCSDLSGHRLTLPAQPTRATSAHTDAVTDLVEQSSQADWAGLLEEMVNKPGRILIDLTEALNSTLLNSSAEVSNEILFLPREIKGLERSTVVLFGLNAIYERAIRLCEDGETDTIPRFEARRLFDEIRVALSRSTHTLVLIERLDAPVLPVLGITREVVGQPNSAIMAISWDDLLDILRTEEMSELEAIEGYLDEVDDLIERSRWTWAYRRNRRAYALAVEIEDEALQRETDSQYIAIHIHEAASLFTRSEWSEAYDRNREAHELALDFGDPELLDQIAQQLQEFRETLAEQVESLHQQALKWCESNSYKIAYRDAKAAYELAQSIQDEKLLPEVGQNYFTICTRWAYQLTELGASESDRQQARLLMEEMVTRGSEINTSMAQAWQIIRNRYSADSQIGQLTAPQIERVLAYATEWAEIDFAERQAKGRSAIDGSSEAWVSGPSIGIHFILRWLDEIFCCLDEQLIYFYKWAVVAQRVIGQAKAVHFIEYTWSLDDCLWDLENRVEHLLAENPHRAKRTQQALDHFAAFMHGYHGRAAEATLAWEVLGNFEEAGHQARLAGQLERAYDLLRQSKTLIPEEVAISVKVLRLLEQLETKYDGLTDAERRTLVTKLDLIQADLTPESEAHNVYVEAK
ncbi:MAG: hypothetical protein AAF702_14055 [Chloroflexota bacterium]